MTGALALITRLATSHRTSGECSNLQALQTIIVRVVGSGELFHPRPTFRSGPRGSAREKQSIAAQHEPLINF
jgi:hypothetical protein